jgi:hypothetical protein
MPTSIRASWTNAGRLILESELSAESADWYHDLVAEKVYGPKSYFPSIEKKYGQPISHWKKILELSGLVKHMEMVNLLKTEHGMGHGHANAIVGDFRQERGI